MKKQSDAKARLHRITDLLERGQEMQTVSEKLWDFWEFGLDQSGTQNPAVIDTIYSPELSQAEKDLHTLLALWDKIRANLRL